MADPSPIPPAQKARTISHMNKDHRPDMRHILTHYPSVPPPPSSFFTTTTPTKTDDDTNDSDPLMLDISLTTLTLHLPASNTTHAIAFTPPLASWEEHRPRLVEMTRVTREAAAATTASGTRQERDGGIGVVVVDEYMLPRVPYDLSIFFAVLFYYLCFVLVQTGWVADGGVLARGVEVGGLFPGGVEGFRWLVRVIFVPVVGIHLVETWLLERTRLRKYGVRRGGKVWWLWVGSVFIEGAMAFKRFDIVVERLKARGEGKKVR